MFHINTEDDYSLKLRGLEIKLRCYTYWKRNDFVRYKKEIVSSILKKLDQTNDLHLSLWTVWCIFYDQCFTYIPWLYIFYDSWILKIFPLAGKSLTKIGYLKIIERAIDRLSAFAAHTSKFLSCCGVRMRPVILSRLEKLRIVLRKNFCPPTRSEKEFGSYFSPTYLLLLPRLVDR